MTEEEYERLKRDGYVIISPKRNTSWQNGEKESVCNMPEIANINIHKSKETDKYYIDWIPLTKMSTGKGYWHDTREISEWEVKNVIEFLDSIGAEA